MTQSPNINVVIFAHGEGELLRRALTAVSDAGIERIYILVNGGTETTVRIARELAEQDPRVLAVEITLGDKCNAWNLFVRELFQGKGPCFFMDGDCWCPNGTISEMASALLEAGANAIAGLPINKRTSPDYRNQVVHERWVFGGLYGVAQCHMEALRSSHVQLPIGLLGNDHVVTRFMWSDKSFRDQQPSRVTYLDGHGFFWDAVSPWRLNSIVQFIRQQKRYRWRAHQLTQLRQLAVKELPATMDEVNLKILQSISSGQGLHVPQEIRGPNAPVQHSIYDRWILKRLHQMYPSNHARYFENHVPSSKWRIISSKAVVSPTT